MSGRAMVWDSVEGSSVVDLLSDSALSYGNSNVITNSTKARIVGTLNGITNSNFGTVIGDQNTLINSPDCSILGGKNFTINASTYKTTAIPNDYVVTNGCIRSDASALGGTPVYQQIPTVTSVPTSDNDVNTRPIPGGALTYCSANSTFYTKGAASTWHDVKTSFNPQTLTQTLAAGSVTGANDVTIQQKLIMPTAQAVGTTNLLNITSGAGVPTSVPTVGSLYYDTAGSTPYFYNGAAWTKFHFGNPETLAVTLAQGANTGANNIIVDFPQSVQFIGSSTGKSIINTAQSGVTDRTISLPNLAANDTFVTLAATQTLTGKTLTSPTISGAPVISGGSINNTSVGATTASTGRFTTVTATATTNQVVLGTTNTVTVTSPAPAASRTHTIPIATVNDTFVMNATQGTLTNKLFSDTTAKFMNVGDNTKTMRFDLGFVNTASEAVVQIAPGTSTNGYLVTTDGVLVLTNKNLTNNNNTVYSEALFCANKTANVSVSAAAVPLAGQSLTATSGTVAVWRYPQTPYIAVGTSSEDSFVCISGTPQDITGSTVTIVTAGTYKFDWSSYISSSVAGSDLQIALYINGTVVLNSIRKLTPPVIAGKIPISTFALITVAAGDIVKIQVATTANMTVGCGFRTLIGKYVSV